MTIGLTPNQGGGQIHKSVPGITVSRPNDL